jgi:L-asparagine oxygenase
LLLCLRGDPAAGTTLASADVLLEQLGDETISTLTEPRFRTAVDASFLDGRPGPPGELRPVLRLTDGSATMVYDADLTTGVDHGARRALDLLGAATTAHHTTVVLRPGDLLIVDNDAAVHGRTAFTPRFDGTDRWLQRTFVVDDLAPSAGERAGRVITTEFAVA